MKACSAVTLDSVLIFFIFLVSGQHRSRPKIHGKGSYRTQLHTDGSSKHILDTWLMFVQMFREKEGVV